MCYLQVDRGGDNILGGRDLAGAQNGKRGMDGNVAKIFGGF